MSQENDLEKEKARELYFQYVPIKKIAEKLLISHKTIEKWIYNPKNGWKEERTKYHKRIITEIREENSDKITKFVSMSLSYVANEMARLIKEQNKLSIPEIKMVAEVAIALDKLMRLDQGEATDIIEQRTPLTVREIRDILLKDHFIEVSPINDNKTQELLPTPEAKQREPNAGYPGTEGTDPFGTS